MEYIIFVECVVEVHVVYLHAENHVDFGVTGVGWERADAQLDNANRCDAEKDDIEEEAVHPGLVLFHGVEPAAEGQPDTEFYVAFLYAPEHIEAQVGKNEGTDKSCIVIL